MEVLGRDSAAECTRVAVKGVVARLPDAVISSEMALTGGRGHQTAYEWIARHGREIETAIDRLRRGMRPKPPFDVMELEALPSCPET
ncbi:MAG: hypothetical protein QNJ13_06785 [Paracoccaceae bacterium]|nr:hypothetical protein [Paracoccaceae bacterium]